MLKHILLLFQLWMLRILLRGILGALNPGSPVLR
jgi:hypothetical protein